MFCILFIKTFWDVSLTSGFSGRDRRISVDKELYFWFEIIDIEFVFLSYVTLNGFLESLNADAISLTLKYFLPFIIYPFKVTALLFTTILWAVMVTPLVFVIGVISLFSDWVVSCFSSLAYFILRLLSG